MMVVHNGPKEKPLVVILGMDLNRSLENQAQSMVKVKFGEVVVQAMTISMPNYMSFCSQVIW